MKTTREKLVEILRGVARSTDMEGRADPLLVWEEAEDATDELYEECVAQAANNLLTLLQGKGA